MLDENIESLLRGYKDTVRRLETGLDLEAEIMLRMVSKKVKTSDKTGKTIEKEQISLQLQDTATYTLEGGKRVKFVEESGIPIHADSGTIAEVTLYKEEDIDGSKRDYVSKIDDKGIVYAKIDELREAWRSVKAYVEQIESHTVDIKRICPEAKTDRKGPVQVSVAGHGKYFNSWQSDETFHIPSNYHTYRKQQNKEVSEPIFLPENERDMLRASIQLMLESGQPVKG